MSNLSTRIRFVLLPAFVLLSVFLAPGVRAQTDAPIAFTLLGPDGAIARVITPLTECPEISMDGTVSAMQVRASPDENFPVTVCDAAIPPATQNVSVDGQTLKLPKAKPAHIAVIGDTGCRIKGENVQGCNDPVQWPFAQIADTAAQGKPDLVIHVGDYHYRESPCLVDKADCAGSPYGDNWASWNADFFTPARTLLQTAPWVMVRGNHEDCARAGNGYFRLLDPRPMPNACLEYSEPYAIAYMEPQLLIVDDSAVNDYEIEPAQVQEFEKQFAQVNAQAAKMPSWILVHDPMYAFGHAGQENGQEKLFQDQPTLQQATNNTFPETVQAFLSGHLHLFETLSFAQGRPPQLLVGNSGTLLDPPITTPLKGLEIAGMAVEEGISLDKFGYAAMYRTGDHWAIGVRDTNGEDMDKCLLGGGKLSCGQTTLPVGGTEIGSHFWFVLALFGSSIFAIGLALTLRARSRYQHI